MIKEPTYLEQLRDAANDILKLIDLVGSLATNDENLQLLDLLWGKWKDIADEDTNDEYCPHFPMSGITEKQYSTWENWQLSEEIWPTKK